MALAANSSHGNSHSQALDSIQSQARSLLADAAITDDLANARWNVVFNIQGVEEEVPTLHPKSAAAAAIAAAEAEAAKNDLANRIRAPPNINELNVHAMNLSSGRQSINHEIIRPRAVASPAIAAPKEDIQAFPLAGLVDPDYIFWPQPQSQVPNQMQSQTQTNTPLDKANVPINNRGDDRGMQTTSGAATTAMDILLDAGADQGQGPVRHPELRLLDELLVTNDIVAQLNILEQLRVLRSVAKIKQKRSNLTNLNLKLTIFLPRCLSYNYSM
jgi:hypothetical protein